MTMNQPHEHSDKVDGQAVAPENQSFDDSGPNDAGPDAAGDIDQAMRDGHDEVHESRDDEMTRLRHEVDDANKRTLQAQADAENFRKRMRRDYEDQLKYASVPLVGDILQVRDNLSRAVEAARAGDDGSSVGLIEGVAMVAKQLDDALAKHHVHEVPAAGVVFDPNIHEAISQMPSPDVEAGHVAHVAVTGFQMHERIIRPAQVVVSTGGN